MNMHLSVAVAAIIGLAGVSNAQTDARPGEENDQQQAGQVQHDGRPIEEATANNIRGTLATITEAALTREQFRSVVQRLTDADQERIGDYARQGFEELDGRIAQFQEDWRARYGQDFDIDNRELVYPAEFVQIFEGHVGEAGLAAGQIDPQQDRQEQDGRQDRQQQDQQQQHGRQDQQDRQQEQDEPRAEAEAEPERDRDQEGPEHKNATVIIPASHGLPEVTVHMVNEGTIMDAWRIDLPDHVDGPKLKENIQTHLTVANERMHQWPADINEAYRMVTHHVLLAVMDVHPDQYEDAQPAGHEQNAQQLEPLNQRQGQQRMPMMDEQQDNQR